MIRIICMPEAGLYFFVGGVGGKQGAEKMNRYKLKSRRQNFTKKRGEWGATKCIIGGHRTNNP